MKLKEIREANGLTQFTTSKLLGVSRGTYSLWEVEHDLIPLKRLNTFCNLFNVSIDYALEFTNLKCYPNLNKEIDMFKSSKRLKIMRKNKHHTQDYIGKKFNLNRSLISKYEKGDNLISTTFLIEYVKLYNISADYLLGKIDNPITITKKEMQIN